MEETKKCPYCGEEILAVARKCKHCGEWLDVNEQNIQISHEEIHDQVETQIDKDNNQELSAPPLKFFSNRGVSTFLLIVIPSAIILTPFLVAVGLGSFSKELEKLFRFLGLLIIMPSFWYFNMSNEGKTLRLYRYKVYGITVALFAASIFLLAKFIDSSEIEKPESELKHLSSYGYLGGADLKSNGANSKGLLGLSDAIDEDFLLGSWEMSNSITEDGDTLNENITYHTDGSCKIQYLIYYNTGVKILVNVKAKWTLNNGVLTKSIVDPNIQYKIIEGDIIPEKAELFINFIREEILKNKVSESKVEKIDDNVMKEIEDGEATFYRRK